MIKFDINVNLNRDCGLLITDGGIFRKIRLAEFQKQVINIGDDYETIRTDLEPADFIEDGIHFLFKDGSEKSTEQYRELATFLYGENYNESTFLLPNSLDYSIMGDLDDDIGIYDPTDVLLEHVHNFDHIDKYDHRHRDPDGIARLSRPLFTPNWVIEVTNPKFIKWNEDKSTSGDIISNYEGVSDSVGIGKAEFSRLNVLKFIIAKIEE